MAQHSRAGKSVELAATFSQPRNGNLAKPCTSSLCWYFVRDVNNFLCLVNFVSAVAYHFCFNLPAAFTQPGALTFADVYINWQFSGHSVKNYFAAVAFHGSRKYSEAMSMSCDDLPGGIILRLGEHWVLIE